MYRHSSLWDVETCSIALKTTENYFPLLQVFAGKTTFLASSCRQNGPSQLAPVIINQQKFYKVPTVTHFSRF